MSHEYEARLELERERKRQLELEAVRERTNALLEKFEAERARIRQSDGAAFVQSDLQSLEMQMARVRSLVQDSPEQALALAQTINSTIYTLYELGGARKLEQERREELLRLRKLEQEKKNRSELFKDFLSAQEAVEDQTMLSFVKDELSALAAKIENNAFSASSSIEQNKAKLSEALKAVFETGSARKAEYIKKEQEKAARANLLLQLEAFKSTLETHRIDAELKAAYSEELASLSDKIATGTDFSAYEAAFSDLQTREQADVVHEKTRRLAVKSIKSMLEKHGFMVASPKLKKENGKNYVSIIAQQASSERTAEFDIEREGKIHYQLLNYEGLTCVKEFEQIEADLESIYSFTIEEKVDLAHNNPDRISKNAKELPGSAHIHGGR